CHGSFLLSHSGRRRTALLPMPAFLQCVDDLARHVVLVVLGEDARCGEDAIGAQLSLCDSALSFAEEIRQQALIDDPDVVFAIGYAKPAAATVGASAETVRLH